MNCHHCQDNLSSDSPFTSLSCNPVCFVFTEFLSDTDRQVRTCEDIISMSFSSLYSSLCGQTVTSFPYKMSSKLWQLLLHTVLSPCWLSIIISQWEWTVPVLTSSIYRKYCWYFIVAVYSSRNYTFHCSLFTTTPSYWSSGRRTGHQMVNKSWVNKSSWNTQSTSLRVQVSFPSVHRGVAPLFPRCNEFPQISLISKQNICWLLLLLVVVVSFSCYSLELEGTVLGSLPPPSPTSVLSSVRKQKTMRQKN